mmetsp:Transcript_69661/g.167197  ORF Transcript_69661/g.167197 Transcript_69661/m.167197 type:complete len:204 (+) Transcript_69661:2073-2684(+)
MFSTSQSLSYVLGAIASQGWSTLASCNRVLLTMASAPHSSKTSAGPGTGSAPKGAPFAMKSSEGGYSGSSFAGASGSFGIRISALKGTETPPPISGTGADSCTTGCSMTAMARPGEPVGPVRGIVGGRETTPLPSCIACSCSRLSCSRSLCTPRSTTTSSSPSRNMSPRTSSLGSKCREVFNTFSTVARTPLFRSVDCTLWCR